MRTEHGTVSAVKDGMILVDSKAESFCAHCGAKDSCAAIDDDSRKRQIWMKNTAGAVIGDRVIFGIREEGVILSSLLLYLLPVICLAAGAAAGAAFSSEAGQEKWACAGGAAGILFSGFVIFICSGILKKKKKNIFEPVLLEKEKS